MADTPEATPARAMPSFTKSPSALVDRFGQVMDRYPEAERKQMFGYPAAFVGGHMATGLFAEHWVVRVPDDQMSDARALGASTFEPMAGRPMKAFLKIPPADVDDDDAIGRWVEQGLAAAAGLPAKASATKKRG